VNSLTLKKAVMIIYCHADIGRVAVDKRTTVAMQAMGTFVKG